MSQLKCLIKESQPDFVTMMDSAEKKRSLDSKSLKNPSKSQPDFVTLMDYKHPDKCAYWKTIFFISRPKHMMWVLKRTVSMRRFLLAPKTHV